MEYPLKFKAAVLERNNAPLTVSEVIFPGPLGAGQVLVRIRYSGICGKQIEEIKGTKPDPFLPHLLGHEGSGVVVDIGPGVKKVGIGDHVVLHWVKGSGINADTPIYTRSGKRVNAGWITTFNEYGVISENRLTPIPGDFDLRLACLFGCAVTTGVGVILNEANLRPGESVAVFGCGGVGLNAIQAAALVQGYPIIGVDKNEESLILAKKFGATHTIPAALKDPLREITKITDGHGVKYVIVALTQPKAIETAVRASSIPGTVFFVGVPDSDSTITIEPFGIHLSRKLAGSCGGGTFPDKDIPNYMGLYKRGRLKIKELITQVVSLGKINSGIENMLSGKTGRCVVEVTES